MTSLTVPPAGRLRRRRPRQTLRFRLAALYAIVVFATGVVLLAIPNLLVGSRSTVVISHRHHPAVYPARALVVSQHGHDVHILAVGSAVALVIMVPLSFALGWLLAGRILRPLRIITTTAREISATNLSERLRLGGPNDELKELGGTLDELFARLEASFESQRRFVANASHELRTPLTAERTLLQVALADPVASTDALRSACAEVLTLGEQQERLIDALLTLATSERGVEQWDPIDLAALVADAVEVRRPEAERNGLGVGLALASATTAGDRRLIESLVTNLIDNAIVHNVVGGRIEVATSATTDGAQLTVSNTGPVIPPGEADRLFEPFHRSGGARINHSDGHGLGLAIVRAIADAHGATLAARPLPAGGLEVEVVFATGIALYGVDN